jgi:hypothetical protein
MEALLMATRIRWTHKLIISLALAALIAVFVAQVVSADGFATTKTCRRAWCSKYSPSTGRKIRGGVWYGCTIKAADYKTVGGVHLVKHSLNGHASTTNWFRAADFR